MYDDKTIIISCAGMGKRLGLGIPKALIEIEGKPLIIRHLEMLKDCSDVRIVVGYKAEEVIKTVTKYRRDITFVFNHDYMNNGTGASVTLASKFANKYVITIDGDLLIHPDDMKKILDHPTSFIGVCKASTDNPVLTEIKNNKVVEFSREHGSFEWTGVSQFESAKIQGGNGHVYQLLEPSLPTDYIFLRTKEIDTPNDHEHAIKWVKNNFSDNITIGVLGGMGTVATANFFDRLINAFPAEKEWDRPRIIIDNRCSMPSRVRAALYNERKEELINSLNESVLMLDRSNCDYIILACNTSHIFLKDIINNNPKLKNKILNIITLCAKDVSKNTKMVNLLASEGTILSKVYHDEFKKYKIKIEPTEEKAFVKMRSWIEAVKQQKITDDIVNDFVDYINNSNSDDIILGCTELPVLYQKCSQRITKNIYDPLESVIKELIIKQNEATK